MPTDAHRQVEFLDERVLKGTDATFPVEQQLPRGLRVGCQGSRHGDAGDDDVGETVPLVANFDDVVMCPAQRVLPLFVPLLLGPSAARIVAGRLAQYRPKANATLCPPKPNQSSTAYWYSP